MQCGIVGEGVGRRFKCWYADGNFQEKTSGGALVKGEKGEGGEGRTQYKKSFPTLVQTPGLGGGKTTNS